MIVITDQQRSRWAAARRRMGIGGVGEESHGSAGLAKRIEGLSARIVLLPSDPEAHLFDIDDRFSEGWRRASADLAVNQKALLGSVHGVFANGFVSYAPVGAAWGWYCSVDHAGAIDVCLGVNAASQREGRRTFNLVAIVGRTWWACGLQDGLAQELSVPGPWELSVSLFETAGAHLGGLGAGWVDKWRDAPQRRADDDASLFFRREIEHFSGDSARDTAFSIGRQIENAFGANPNRFLPAYTRTLTEFEAATGCLSA